LKKLPLTLIGHIATIKMKILPQINYLFSMIPITPTDCSKNLILSPSISIGKMKNQGEHLQDFKTLKRQLSGKKTNIKTSESI